MTGGIAGSRAVVVGASIAGLLAARALTDAYEEVTIVERDRLPPLGEQRKAVPQGRHVHVLLPAGRRSIEGLLPGFGDALVAAGAVPFAPDRLRFELAGHLLTKHVAGNVDQSSLSATRPLIEGLIRQRVSALPGVRVLDGATVEGLETDASGSTVRGVRIAAGDGVDLERSLRADVVVGATGRAAQVPAWLEEFGYDPPAEEKLTIKLRYATRCLRRSPDALAGDRWVLVGARPGRPRSLALSAVEGDRWLLTLGGYGSAHHPPSDERGFSAFAAELAPPDVAREIAGAEPLGDIATFGFRANQRRAYERLDRLPEGLLVVGDAIASFNPLYGQGMTVAALEAAALRDCLAAGPPADALQRRFLRAARRYVDHAWELAISSDLALPEVDGRRPLRVRALNAYTERLLAAAERDPVVATALRDVVGMLRRPSHLLRPDLAARAVRPRSTRRSVRRVTRHCGDRNRGVGSGTTS